MKRLPVNLKDKQHTELRKIAYDEGKSMSDIIRRAVEEFIARRKGNKTDEVDDETLS